MYWAPSVRDSRDPKCSRQSFQRLLVRHLFLVAMRLFLIASCYVRHLLLLAWHLFLVASKDQLRNWRSSWYTMVYQDPPTLQGVPCLEAERPGIVWERSSQDTTTGPLSVRSVPEDEETIQSICGTAEAPRREVNIEREVPPLCVFLCLWSFSMEFVWYHHGWF